jgi:hypothetical protein
VHRSDEESKPNQTKKRMKQKILAIAAVAVLTAFASQATSYTDTTGDLHNGVPTGDNLSGHTHLDITSVEVTNNVTDLIFKINLSGNPVTTDWGKYCIGFDTNPATGDLNSLGNGWGRRISMQPRGMDFWIGTWVDGTMGAGLSWYDGVAWNGSGGASVSKDASSVTISVSMANLGKSFGDTVDFDIYTTGGGTDTAVDALSNPAVSAFAWSDNYTNNNVSTYTIAALAATTNNVTFTVDMGVPIWEFDTLAGPGFSTNADTLYVRGSFNGWGTVSAGYNLIQVGPTLFSNTVEVVSLIGDTIQYKFEGFSFPGYENPVLLGGGNRTLVVSGANVTAPTVCFSDRCLTDPPVSTVRLEVDMSVVRNFGKFDPSTNGVTLPGNFNGWNNSAIVMAAGAAPDTNIYSGTLTYNYYPIAPGNVGFYKFFISNLVDPARDNGWEQPISSGGGNRAFAINTTTQTNRYFYNDENPIINASIQALNANDVKVTFSSFPSRGGGVNTGGVYAVESRVSLSDPWTTNSVVGSTTSSTSVTNTGVLPGTPQQYYRVGLIGL